jgi:hypothetical protein
MLHRLYEIESWDKHPRILWLQRQWWLHVAKPPEPRGIAGAEPTLHLLQCQSPEHAYLAWMYLTATDFDFDGTGGGTDFQPIIEDRFHIDERSIQRH